MKGFFSRHQIRKKKKAKLKKSRLYDFTLMTIDFRFYSKPFDGPLNIKQHQQSKMYLNLLVHQDCHPIPGKSFHIFLTLFFFNYYYLFSLIFPIKYLPPQNDWCVPLSVLPRIYIPCWLHRKPVLLSTA